MTLTRTTRAPWAAGIMAIMLGALAVAGPSGIATGQSARHIVSQPARDVGLEKIKVPPLLEKVSENPYTLDGTGSCSALSSSIAALTRIVGPDYSSSAARNKANMAGIGGTAVVNSLIPFRGLVRAVSGASAADRRRAAAVDAGVARRGFLHGMQIARKCR